MASGSGVGTGIGVVSIGVVVLVIVYSALPTLVVLAYALVELGLQLMALCSGVAASFAVLLLLPDGSAITKEVEVGTSALTEKFRGQVLEAERGREKIAAVCLISPLAMMLWLVTWQTLFLYHACERVPRHTRLAMGIGAAHAMAAFVSPFTWARLMRTTGWVYPVLMSSLAARQAMLCKQEGPSDTPAQAEVSKAEVEEEG
eukprot:NODE_18830_length_874_cov_4.879518.p1 GENE.NODE_18830_length_874_cov_4.879518~~NODE_18830_length_874_cov_4.879518.p1  ORF type:complete len:202 (-),score=39.72 NODE_18830_length_874_cov_4.879518:181-786(-)